MPKEIQKIFLDKMLQKLGASRHRQVGGRDLSIPFSYYKEANKEHIFELMEEAYEVGKRDEREKIIEIINSLEAPDCADDSCEYIHNGYFKALEDIIKSLQTNKE